MFWWWMVVVVTTAWVLLHITRTDSSPMGDHWVAEERKYTIERLEHELLAPPYFHSDDCSECYVRKWAHEVTMTEVKEARQRERARACRRTRG